MNWMHLLKDLGCVLLPPFAMWLESNAHVVGQMLDPPYNMMAVGAVSSLAAFLRKAPGDPRRVEP